MDEFYSLTLKQIDQLLMVIEHVQTQEFKVKASLAGKKLKSSPPTRYELEQTKEEIIVDKEMDDYLINKLMERVNNGNQSRITNKD